MQTPHFPPLKTVNTDAVPCKVCEAPAALFGVVDFHKSCLDHQRAPLTLSGIPIYYRRCPSCRLIFTDVFDDWSVEDFRAAIYNQEYLEVDPDYTEVRPRAMATTVTTLFGAARGFIRLIDYGAGEGRMAELLTEEGFSAESYDPYTAANRRPERRADVVTSFETLEHSSDPLATLDDMLSMLAPEGVLLFSTLLQPADIDLTGLRWWYVGPRNGHLTIFSRDALVRLCESRELTLASSSDGLHLAWRTLPAFARHLIPGS